jgi:hypothetical protein
MIPQLKLLLRSFIEEVALLNLGFRYCYILNIGFQNLLLLFKSTKRVLLRRRSDIMLQYVSFSKMRRDVILYFGVSNMRDTLISLLEWTLIIVPCCLVTVKVVLDLAYLLWSRLFHCFFTFNDLLVTINCSCTCLQILVCSWTCFVINMGLILSIIAMLRYKFL